MVIDSMRRSLSTFCSLLVLLISLIVMDAASAQAATDGIHPSLEYQKRVKAAETLSPLDTGLFGESVSLYDGSTQFRVVELDLPGNNGLPVQLARRLTVQLQPQGTIRDHDARLLGFGNWDVEVPYVSATYSTATGLPARVCSVGSVPTSGVFSVREYWSGLNVHLPGRGDTAMLAITAGTPLPTGWPGTRLTTRERDAIDCIGLGDGSRDGFRLTTAEGVRYYFNQLATRREAPLQKMVPTSDGNPPASRILQRTRYYLLATKIEDRFGNTVQFAYGADGLPTRIWSSDAREITFVHTQGRISSASANGRTWRFDYSTQFPDVQLTAVTRPDGSSWSYAYVGTLLPSAPTDEEMLPSLPWCSAALMPLAADFLLTATHPSGAVGTFSFSNRRHWRQGVHQNECYQKGPALDPEFVLDVPYYFDVLSIASKSIAGAGLQEMRWSYDFGSATSSLWGSRNEAANYPCTTCASTKQVSVHRPDGTLQRLTFGNLYMSNDGRELSEETIDAKGAVARVRSTEYMVDAAVAAQPFIGEYGGVLGSLSDPATVRIRPVTRVVLQQDWGSHVWQANSFDAYARPVSVTRSNSHGGSRTDVTSYYNDTAGWVLGLVASQTNSDTGLVEVQNTYDGNAQLTEQRSFGRSVQRLSYYADGSLASITDGKGNVTTLEQWMRGVPRWIRYADGTMRTAAVNDDGWITAVSDENGYVTRYGHDAMGRLTRREYPGDDTVAWNATTQAFDWVPFAELGIPAGHWRQTTVTGNARKITHFDALLRPLLLQEFDAGDQANTQRLQLFAYDIQGRLTFSSYPAGNYPVPLKGVWQEYDALDRPTTSAQDSEHGLLTTLTEYLPGGQMRVTNPRGQVTQTRFQMFDEPSYGHPVSIQMPEGAVMNIARDVFNKPLSIARGNADGSQTVARRYVYSPSQQLCKTIEPETGSTLMDYDGAGNLIRSASGVDSPSPLTCNTEAISSSGRAVYREYDVRNRPRYLRFPDGNGNTDWTYTPDGLPSRLTVWNDAGATMASNHYTYNKRRLLTMEGLSQPGWYDWPIVYNYNANGHLAGMAWPSGHSVDYAPDALGQATRVGTFATDVRYYANGGIKQFTYGNGIVRTMQQNERQLPSRTADTGVLDFDMRFDRNGNVSDIYDLALGPFYNRHMLYDGLDRLIAAGSNNFGGDSWHRFSYDALDNLTSWMLPGVKDHRYWYDAHNRLTNVRDGAGNTLIGLSYDVQGNLKLKNGLNHSFDFGNRLREVTGKETYRYDALGRRILAYSPTKGNVLSQYAQDGRLVFQRDERKGLWHEYVHLAGSLIARRDYGDAEAKITYLHTDALGSPVASTDASGNVIERTHYEPYGAPIGKVVDGPGYTGHVMDGETGLVQMQQRYYDPQLGLLLSVDPVSTHSSPKHFNRYSYAYGNPYSFTDPDGRVPVMPFIYGAVLGGVADIAVQKAMNPDKPIDKVEVGIAAAVGSVSGGAGGLAVAAVGSGTISVGRAVAIQTVVNAAAGGAGSAAESAIKGLPITAEGVASNAIGSAVGGLGASGVGVAMGDFAGPAARGTLQRLSQSRGPGGPNMASATASTGTAIPRQSALQGAASQAGQGLAGAGATVVQKDLERKK